VLGVKHASLGLEKHVLGPAQKAQQHQAVLRALQFTERREVSPGAQDAFARAVELTGQY
jgi:hypothetical protein